MSKKKASMDYSELIARAAAEEDEAVMDEEIMLPQEDHGVDYEAEYRKQTGNDFVTGEIVVQ